jgi:hypothetical protein
MKIAVDNQIGKIIVDILKQRKFDIVFRAQDEADHEWIEKALDLGATVFVSPDFDIPFYLDKEYPDESYKWVELPQNLPKRKQCEFLTKKLSAFRSSK